MSLFTNIFYFRAIICEAFSIAILLHIAFIIFVMNQQVVVDLEANIHD